MSGPRLPLAGRAAGLMRGRRMRALWAVVCVLGAVTAGTPAAAAASSSDSRRQAAASRAVRALEHRGYQETTAACRLRTGRATRCSWKAVKRQATCSGSLTVALRRRRGIWVTVTSTRCSPVLFGFNTFANSVTIPLELPTGVSVQRVIAPWASVETVPGVWTWDQIDGQYKASLEAGLKPIVIATAAPCWARVKAGCPDPVASGPPDPAFEPRWQEYVRRLAERYPDALAVEVWNEPNLKQVFWPQADPVRYTRLLSQAYTAVKAARPAMPVISGGLLAHGDSGTGPGGVGDVTFLQGMLEAGAARWLDGIGVHPYPEVRGTDGGPSRWDPDAAQRTLDALRAVRATAGAAGKPFWITEVGESTATQAGFPLAVTPEQQALDLVRIARAAVSARDVRVVVFHTLTDEFSDSGQTAVANVLQPLTGISLFYNGVASGFGVYDARGRPKPAACAISRELGGTLRC